MDDRASPIKRARRLLREYRLYLIEMGAFMACLVAVLAYRNKLGVWFYLALPMSMFPLILMLPQAARSWRDARRARALRDLADYQREHGIIGYEEPGFFQICPYQDSKDDQDRYMKKVAILQSRDHKQVLQWIQDSSEPILFLTGASGTGKSSLLSAYIIPKLREASPPVRTILLRSFGNPVEALRNELVAKDCIWSRVPAEAESWDTPDLLEKAVTHLTHNRGMAGLLVVFDQFEELLILNDLDPDCEQLRPTRALLQSLQKRPISGLTVLLSLRKDYDHMLKKLGLAPPHELHNMRQIEPVPERTARRLLSASGYEIPDARLDGIMAEAASLEGARGQYRLIVLNMLGRLLAREPERVPESREPGDMLANSLRRSLNEGNKSGYAGTILKPMLTAAGTKRPLSIPQLMDRLREKASGLDEGIVEGCLASLGHDGMVRRIDWGTSAAEGKVQTPDGSDDEEPDRDTRPEASTAAQSDTGFWEISHDFLARLLDQIIRTPRRSFWQRVGPSVTCISLALWVIAFVVVLPLYAFRIAPAMLAIEIEWQFRGVSIDYQGDNIYHATFTRDLSQKKFADAIGRLKELPVLGKLEVTSCSGLTEVDLSGLTDLKTLDLSDSDTMTNVDLRGLTALQTLVLSRFRRLTKVDLSAPTALKTLVLDSCDGLPEVDLSGLTGLETLDLSGCAALSKVDPSGLTALKRLDLSGCRRLTEVDLSPLTDLEKLDLSHCAALSKVDLSGLTALRSLNLGDCDGLTKVDLSGLTALRSLNLGGCDGLPKVDLSGLTDLQTLDLSHCAALSKVDLSGLAALQTLDLIWCRELAEVDLSDQTALQALYIARCDRLTKVDLNGLTALKTLELSLSGQTKVDLSGLAALTTLDLSGLALTEVDLSGLTAMKTLKLSLSGQTKVDLSGLTGLQTLDLSWSHGLTEVDLSGLTALQTLDLTRCDGLAKVDLSDQTALKELRVPLRILRTSYDRLLSMRGLTTLKVASDVSEPAGKEDIDLLKRLGGLTSLRRLRLRMNIASHDQKVLRDSLTNVDDIEFR